MILPSPIVQFNHSRRRTGYAAALAVEKGWAQIIFRDWRMDIAYQV